MKVLSILDERRTVRRRFEVIIPASEAGVYVEVVGRYQYVCIYQDLIKRDPFLWVSFFIFIYMINLNTYLIEKLHLNKDIDNNITMSFSQWCDYINKETDGCIFRNTRHFWIITLKKYEDAPAFPAHPELCIEVPPEKQNYWRWHKNNEEGATSNKDITIHWGAVEKDYTIKLEDLDRDNAKRFTFTKNNADQIIKLFNDIESDL